MNSNNNLRILRLKIGFWFSLQSIVMMPYAIIVMAIITYSADSSCELLEWVPFFSIAALVLLVPSGFLLAYFDRSTKFLNEEELKKRVKMWEENVSMMLFPPRSILNVAGLLLQKFGERIEAFIKKKPKDELREYALGSMIIQVILFAASFSLPQISIVSVLQSILLTGAFLAWMVTVATLNM